MLHPFPALGSGPWLVKWIDRFHNRKSGSQTSSTDRSGGHGGGAASASVEVLLQRLPLKVADDLEGLSRQDIAELLGKPPSRSGRPQPVPHFKIERVLAGHLAEMRIGQIYSAHVIGEPPQVFQLPLEQHEVTLTDKTQLQSATIGSRAMPPNWWPPKDENYKVLNEFEYRTNSFFDQSNVLLFSEGDIQFILPNTVIFQTFYGLSSKMINAFCNGPWRTTASQVISFAEFKAGFRTAIDEKTGDWLLVLALGMPESPFRIVWSTSQPA